MLKLCTVWLLMMATACASGEHDDGPAGDGAADGDPGDEVADGGDGAADGWADGSDTSDGVADGSDANDGSDTNDGSDANDGEGIVRPSVPQAELASATGSYYDTWKSRYLVPGCEAGQYRVHSEPDTDDYTVSEAHGYGMLFTVLMAAHDTEAQSIFEGMYRYYEAHPSEYTEGLMSWAQNESCEDVAGSNAATDGDLDIAYALLLADKVWGDSGSFDYGEAARLVIDAIAAGELAADDHVLVGDWVDPDEDAADGTRASDFMPDHFKAFAAATGDDRWNHVTDRVYEAVAHVQGSASAASGLLPDFLVGASGASPEPAPPDWLEGEHDGDYHYNACRVPWRLGADFLVYGDARARAAVRKMNDFMRGATAGDPYQIVDGYRLDGDGYGSYPSLAFVAPFLVAAIATPASDAQQDWVDALWDFVSQEDDAGYYSDSIKLAALIAVAGLYPKP